ncbi:hypothetical protein D3C71_921630 [compost metagenome]
MLWRVHHIHMLDYGTFAARAQGAVMRRHRDLALDQQPAKREQKHQQMFFQKAQAVSPAGMHIRVVGYQKEPEYMNSAC